MQITRCLHAAVLVSDLTKAEPFYRQILGLAQIERPFNYRGAWFEIGEFQLHLIEHRNVSIARPNPEKWGRNPHVAMAVDNLEEAKARLQAQGYPFQMSASGRAALFTCDPDGNIIEISQA